MHMQHYSFARAVSSCAVAAPLEPPCKTDSVRDAAAWSASAGATSGFQARGGRTSPSCIKLATNTPVSVQTCCRQAAIARVNKLDTRMLVLNAG